MSKLVLFCGLSKPTIYKTVVVNLKKKNHLCSYLVTLLHHSHSLARTWANTILTADRFVVINSLHPSQRSTAPLHCCFHSLVLICLLNFFFTSLPNVWHVLDNVLLLRAIHEMHGKTSTQNVLEFVVEICVADHHLYCICLSFRNAPS